MATEKQIAANRRNARRSTGPRTPAGKATSARNAIKHGLLAKTALLPDEDENAFREFTEQLVRDLDPVGGVEALLADQIASEWWRLGRYPRIEAGLFIAAKAEADHKYFWDLVMQYQTSAPERELREALSGDSSGGIEITDEAGHAEAVGKLQSAVKAKRSGLAVLGFAYGGAAANGDPFSKASGNQTRAENRLRRLRADLDELQARRRSAGGQSNG